MIAIICLAPSQGFSKSLQSRASFNQLLYVQSDKLADNSLTCLGNGAVGYYSLFKLENIHKHDCLFLKTDERFGEEKDHTYHMEEHNTNT